MKYEVIIHCIGYITIEVEADSRDAAIKEAKAEVEEDIHEMYSQGTWEVELDSCEIQPSVRALEGDTR